MGASRASATLGVTIALVVLSTLFVCLRFVSKGRIVGKVTADDWLILLAWILAFGFSFTICYGTRVGLGLHGDDLHQDWHVPLQQTEYAFSVLYQPSLMATKTSIVIFFLSFSKEENVFRWCNYLTLFVVNAAGFALTVVSIVQCHPVSATFQYPVPATAQCIDILALYLSSAPVNIITDLALLFLPMPILTRMTIPRKQKIILVVTFGCGIFVAAIDVIRIAYLQSAEFDRVEAAQSGSGNSARIFEENNFSWYASLSFMWSAVEVNLGIMVACVPSLKPLFLRFLPSWIRDDDESRKFGSAHSFPEESPSAAQAVVNPITNPAAARESSIPIAAGVGDGEMGFMDFLAAAENDAPMARMSISATNATLNTNTSQRTPTFFDFVNMNRPRNMLRLSNRQSFMPVAVVTILFFLWGFAYGLLDILNQQFQVVVSMSNAQSLGPHAAYYGGYFLGPLTLGRWVLKKYGFKATMISGLVVYACGSLIFWPSAVLASYPAFIISNVIVGFGLSCLEIAANPFIVLCGPLEYAEIRLNLSQGFQAIGTVVSPLLAQKVLFKNVLNAPSLINVQWTYLGIAVFDILLAVALYYVHLPEASDEELDELADRRRAVYTAKVGGRFPVVWVTLVLGVFSQWCYVGGQESIGTTTESLIIALKPAGSPHLTAFDYVTLGHTVFAVGRFFTALLNYLFKPRWILLGLYIGLIVSTALTMSLTGVASIAMMLLVYTFESGVFSIIFAISIRGIGVHTKTASAFMTAAISGGAIPPIIQNAVSNSHGVRYSFCVPLAVYAFGLIFPAYLNLVPEAKTQVDPIHELRTSRRNRSGGRRGTARTMSMSSRNSNSNAFGLKGILARRTRHKANREEEKANDEMPVKDVEQNAETKHQSSSEGGSGSTAVDFAQTDYGQEDDDMVVLGQGPIREIDPLHVEKGREREVNRPTTETAMPSLRDDDIDDFIRDLGQGKLTTPGLRRKSRNVGMATSSGGSVSVPNAGQPSPQPGRVSFGGTEVHDLERQPSHNSTRRSTRLNTPTSSNGTWDLDPGKEVHDFIPWPED